MKRNFGSLNLAALDLNSPFQSGADSAECSLADRFSALDPNAEDYGMDAGSENSSEESVGFPMERLELHADVRSDMDMDTEMPDLSLPGRCHSISRPRSVNGDVRVSRPLHPSSSEIPQHLQDQHNVELNALRCLSLKVMLSNLSTSNNSNNANVSVASKSNYAYPGVNEGAKTALLPIRQPSLQSV